MNAGLKRKPHQGDHDDARFMRRFQEEALDDALKNTFSASDPISIGQLTPPDINRETKNLLKYLLEHLDRNQLHRRSS
jgi:hypothetical protein